MTTSSSARWLAASLSFRWPLGCLLLWCAGFAFSDEAVAPPLRVGDPAPLFVAKHWVAGEPVERLDPNRLYLIEFWATWCDPCVRAMPKLSAIAKHLGDKLTVIGVAIGTRGETQDERVATIRTFVESRRQQITYRIVVDDAEGSIQSAWFEAAKQEGIPCAFLVKDGRIAWIGSGSGEDVAETVVKLLALPDQEWVTQMAQPNKLVAGHRALDQSKAEILTRGSCTPEEWRSFTVAAQDLEALHRSGPPLSEEETLEAFYRGLIIDDDFRADWFLHDTRTTLLVNRYVRQLVDDMDPHERESAHEALKLHAMNQQHWFDLIHLAERQAAFERYRRAETSGADQRACEAMFQDALRKADAAQLIDWAAEVFDQQKNPLVARRIVDAATDKLVQVQDDDAMWLEINASMLRRIDGTPAAIGMLRKVLTQGALTEDARTHLLQAVSDLGQDCDPHTGLDP